ncbi:protease SohB [Ignatzschineria indica]|uniref:Protease SohB n=1 Tax=Ignatzschineria indica TaxID=472583 RepID=A0A2U2AJ11_9GAMM|nr:protease SohB [Ignatzschineria indica]PWD82661.1 protease SohB [Ignatzschineria indica]GGZ85707.1 protease SohB [Ignatzschineria indica]
MAYFFEFILFVAKTGTIIVAFIVALLFLASLRNNQQQSGGKIEFKDLGERYQQIKEGFLEFKHSDLDDKDFKAELEKEESREKQAEALENAAESISEGRSETVPENIVQEDKEDKEGDQRAERDEKSQVAKAPFWQFWKREKEKSKPKKADTLYVLEFDGDIQAEEVRSLREEVSALLQIAEKGDEVLIRLKSPGGAVNGYGLAASQLVRIRDRGIHLTVAVDEVAASGGYLMASVAHKILAAPFAIVGSIGVVAEMPNFHKLLEKYNIDYEQFTAGEYKRTVSMFGENSEAAKEKFRAELNEIHHIFKDFVQQYRPQLEIEQIATGEYWLAVKALELGLVDELKTSDSYILESMKNKNVYTIQYVEKSSVRQGISRFLTRIMKRIPF